MKQKVLKRAISALLCTMLLFSLFGCSAGKKRLVSVTTEIYDNDLLMSKTVCEFKYKGKDKVSVRVESEEETSKSDWIEIVDGVVQIMEEGELVGEFKFSDLGCITEQTVYYEPGLVQSVSKYDDYGMPVEDIVYSPDPEVRFHTVYNQLGLPIQEVYLNVYDLTMDYTVVERDNEDRPTKMRMMKSDGSMGLLTITYSEDGLTRTLVGENITITAKFDEDGRLLYWENSTFAYDRNRQLIIYEYK